jgi:starvation-inducible DNA-binding protein
MENIDTTEVESPVQTALATPSDLCQDGIAEISIGLRQLLVEVFVLYLKTKNYCWHMTGRDLRDYHLRLDKHADQIFVMAHDVAERAHKLGGSTPHSMSDILRNQRLKDNNEELVIPIPKDIAELSANNQEVTRFLRSIREICEQHSDLATASMIEAWIDQNERRTWFLSEIMLDLKEE